MDKTLVENIKRKNLNKIENLELLFNVARNSIDVDLDGTLKLNLEVRRHCVVKMNQLNKNGSYQKARLFLDLYHRTFLLSAPYVFDDYLIYLEKDRQPHERFYQPRRKILKRAVDALQGFIDDTLDELILNMPPRVGKTTLLMMFLTWIIGRDSEKSNLYSAYSDSITKPMYNGALEIITDENTYNWKKIFPDCYIPEGGTNAKEETININRRKRYASLTCRSLSGTLNGSCDCVGVLVSDDLISGIEEAMSKDRLDSAWDKVDNNLLPRGKEKTKFLWCGTRWSLYDPVGRRIELLENDPEYKDRRYEIIVLPALDENGESNFDYDYGVGFSTKYYRQRRASYERNDDMASWFAQYMNQPIEREGTLFSPGDMNFYNGVLPSDKPDRIFAFGDTAKGGGDYVSFPIGYQFGDDLYVHDVVFNKGDKKVTKPLVINKIIKHKVSASTFEANNGGDDYADDIERILREDYGYRMNMNSRPAPTNKSKQFRIYDKSPEIREFYFIQDGYRSKEYQAFMNNLYSYKSEGTNKNDDAPDSLAGLAEMKNGGSSVKSEIFKRPF